MGSGTLKLDAALQNVQRIYIDAAPLIYLVEKHSEYFTKMLRVVSFIETTPLQVFTSVITITEILVQPLRLGNTDLAQEYHDILVLNNEYEIVSITAEIAISAAAIRARYLLRTPDALHAATAIKTGCDAILTNDSDFRRIQDLNVLILDDMEL